MKILFKCIYIIITLVLLTGCSADTYDSEQSILSPAPSPVEQTPAGTAQFQLPPFIMTQPPHDDWSQLCIINAAWLLSELDALLERDNGALWGVHLRGPFMIADSITREVVANMPDERGNLEKQGDVYVGTLDRNALIGTTASEINGQWWGMITWGFIEDHSDDLYYVLEIMAHELFHAWQDELFEGEIRWHDNCHMDELDARVSVRLELNALMKALGTTGYERLDAINDALSIRAERRRNHDGADGEIFNEINEGTAVYTHIRLTRDELPDIIDAMEYYLETYIEGQSMRMFGYMSGALYGFLLDELGATWKQGLHYESDLGALLKNAAGISELKPFGDIDLDMYGFTDITAFETEWVNNHVRLLDEAQEIFSETVLRFESDGDFKSFTDNILVLFVTDFETVFYGNFIFEGAFGQITVTEGFLLLGRTPFMFEVSARDIGIDGINIKGPGWTIELNEGFKIYELPDNHLEVRHG